MKKLFLFMLGLAGMCTVASAQTGFGWGVKGGINLTGVTNLGDNTQTKTGIVVGAFADYRFTDHFALSADVLYSRQGASMGKNDEGVRIKGRLNYLNVPILANYYIVGGLAVKAGIQPGFLLNSKRVTKYDGNTEKRNIEGLSGADFSIPVGVSYDCPFGIILEARYNIGVTNIDSGGSSRNSVFSIMVGYRF